MTAKAKVNYVGGLSYERAGRKFVKGQPQVITDPQEIAHYRSTSGFVVSMLDEPKKEKVAAVPPEPPPAKNKTPVRSKVPTPPPEEDPEEDQDEDVDDEDQDEDDEDRAESPV